MSQEQTKKQWLIESQDDLSGQEIQRQSKIASKYQQLYKELIKPYSESRMKKLKQELIERLSMNKIKYQKNLTNNFLNIHINQCSFNKEVITLHVHYVDFIIPLTILNTSAKSRNHKIDQSYCGSFASTYQTVFNNKEIAIKCHEVKGNFEIIFKSVIKQYCMLKIASVLQAAPTIENPFGFDIIVYQDCIQFSMQFGLNKIKQFKNPSLTVDLKQQLRILHLFNFVHMDIKPQNICYSSTLQKYVFIDYGLSSALLQQLGYCTYTHFRGSYQFASPQMQQSYLMNNFNPVDLYYNDAHCLEMTLIKINQYQVKDNFENISNNEDIQWIQTLQKQKKQNILKQNLQIICKFHLFHIQNPINFKIFKNILDFSEKKLLIKCYPHLLKFIKHLPFSFELQQIQRLYFSTDSKKEEERLHSIHFRTQTIYKSKQIQIQEQNYRLCQDRYEQITKQHNLKLTYLKVNELTGVLSDGNKIKSMPFELYFLVLADQIQINSYEFDKRYKIKVCKLFEQKICKNKKEQLFNFTEDQILQNTINYLINFSLTIPINRIKQQIIYKLLPSLFILQIRQESELQKLFNKILISKIQFPNRLRLIIRFISSLVWLQQKCGTVYNLNYLQSTILKCTHQFLLSTHEYNDKLYLQILVEIVKKKRGLACHSKIQQKIQLALNSFKLYYGQQKYLMQQLIIFGLHYHLELSIFQNFKIYSKNFQIFQMFIWNEKRDRKEIFQYYHFLILHIYLKASIDSACSSLYSLFNKIFRQYPKVKSFTLIINYSFSQVNAFNLPKQEFIKYIANIISYCSSKTLLVLITHISKSILQNQFKQQFLGAQILKKLYLNQHLIRIVNPQVGSQYKLQHKHQMPQMANILVSIYKLLQIHNILDSKQQLTVQYLQTLFNQLLNRSQCLQCKSYCFLHYVQIRASILYQQNQIESIVELYVQAVTFILKFSKMTNQTIFFTNLIIQICFNNPKLLSIYSPLIFQYECLKTSKSCAFYLYEMTQYPRFYYLYQHFIRYGQYDLIYQLIYALTNLLQKQFSTILIFNFFRIIKLIIKQTEEKHQFYNHHQAIITKFKNSKNNYIGLYFAILLSSVESTQTQVHNFIFLKITNSLNSIDFYGRAIILSLYYHQFLYLKAQIFFSMRHRRYLSCKHLKYSVEQIGLWCVMKQKVRIKKRLNSRGERLLKQKVKKYHSKIGNLLQND